MITDIVFFIIVLIAIKKPLEEIFLPFFNKKKMNLEESLKQQIKELNQFVKKQTNYVKNYQTELAKNIYAIDDKAMKAKMNTMLNEAMKGNLSNVQAIAKQLQSDLEIKNKENVISYGPKEERATIVIN